MSGPFGDRIGYGRAKRLWDAWVSQFVSGRVDIGEMRSLQRGIKDLEGPLIELLIDNIRSENGHAQVLAAIWLCVAFEEDPRMISADVVTRAEDIVIGVMLGSDVGLKMTTSLLLLSGGATPRVCSEMSKLYEDPNERVQVYAASAICAARGMMPEGMEILRNALGGKDPLLAVLAAISFLRTGQILHTQAAEQLFVRMATIPSDAQYLIVAALKWVGPSASAILPLLYGIINDDEVHEVVRGLTATAIGRISAGTRDGTPYLMEALKSKSPEVYLSAAEGLALSGYVPQEAVKHLWRILESSESEEERIFAARGLMEFKEHAAPVVDKLCDYLGRDASREVNHAVAWVLGRIGENAVPSLIEMFRAGGFDKFPLAAIALKEIGPAGGKALGELLRTTEDSYVKALCVGALRDFDMAASGALPALIQTLQETDDEETAALAVAAIYGCARVAQSAIPVLIMVLREHSENVAWWATRALWQMGQETIGALQEALSHSTGEAKERIESVLAGLRRRDNENRFVRYEKLGMDKQLALFIRVAEVLLPGKLLTWRQISKEMRSTDHRGRATGARDGISARNLLFQIAKLEEHLKLELTTHKHGGHVGGGLTKTGREELSHIKAYLVAKEERLGRRSH